MSHNLLQEQRRSLLAKVHIAKKDLGLDDDVYRDLLQREFGKRSAKSLTIVQLENLVDYFRSLGWQPRSAKKSQIRALQIRVRQTADAGGIDKKRLAGLVRQKCNVDLVSSCRHVDKLKEILAALSNIIVLDQSKEEKVMS